MLPGFANGGYIGGEAAKRVKQGTMCFCVNQGTISMLTMDLNKSGSDLAHQGCTGGLIIDITARSTVCRLDAPQDQRFTSLDGDRIAVGPIMGEKIGGNIKYGCHLALLAALANQSRITAATQGQGQSIKQYRFACTSLTGQNAQSAAKAHGQCLDQDNIFDGKFSQHGAFRRGVTSPGAQQSPCGT